MIFKWIMFGVQDIVMWALSWVEIPPFPAELMASINSVFDIIFENIGILGFFIRWNTVLICIPLVILLFNFDWIYKGIMWLYRKIPVFGGE